MQTQLPIHVDKKTLQEVLQQSFPEGFFRTETQNHGIMVWTPRSFSAVRFKLPTTMPCGAGLGRSKNTRVS